MCAIFLRVAFCHSQNEDLWFLCSFLFRLFSAHERKERAAVMPSVEYAVVYSFCMVIRMVFTSGWVENAQFISSSGKVL